MALLTGFEIAPILSHQNIGKEICVVGTPVCMDHQSNRHCLATIPQGERFYFDGELDQSKASYTFLRVRIQQKRAYSKFGGWGSNMHFQPWHVHLARGTTGSGVVQWSWCNGTGNDGSRLSSFGGMREPRCVIFIKSIAQQQSFMETFAKWTRSLNWQRFFRQVGWWQQESPVSHIPLLGDCRGGLDPRSSTLPSTLAIAYHLRAMIVVLECVGPAQHDPFVNHHINNFCTKDEVHSFRLCAWIRWCVGK